MTKVTYGSVLRLTMRLMPLKESLGYHLAEDVYDNNGKVLAKRGSELNDQLIDGMGKNGLHAVYIVDQYSEGIIAPIISMDLKYLLVNKLRELYGLIVQRGRGQALVKQTMKLVEELVRSCANLEYELQGRTKPFIDFFDIKSTATYTYEHSVNVAVLAFLLGKHSKLNSNDLHHLLLGALFHDVGMAYIDESIFMKNGKLDLEEFVKIKTHPQLGYEFVKQQTFANAFNKVIALQHHERLDGSGYPKGIHTDEIHRLARHVAVVDVYDAMTSDRPYSRAVPAYMAIDYLMAAAIDKLDFDLTKTFVSTILPYPWGTIVRLTDKRVGVVIDVEPKLSRRPVIQIIDENKKILTSEVLNLSNLYQLEVASIVYRL